MCVSLYFYYINDKSLFPEGKTIGTFTWKSTFFMKVHEKIKAKKEIQFTNTVHVTLIIDIDFFKWYSDLLV